MAKGETAHTYQSSYTVCSERVLLLIDESHTQRERASSAQRTSEVVQCCGLDAICGLHVTERAVMLRGHMLAPSAQGTHAQAVACAEGPVRAHIIVQVDKKL